MAGGVPFVSVERKEELLLFQKNAGLDFHDISLLETALTHSSYANENKNLKISDNERLEFLGDSILALAMSDYLYRNFNLDEGEYTRIRSFVVSEEALAETAVRLNVETYIKIGKGEEYTGGRHKKAILADCMEAIFGACYLDRGFEQAKSYIQSLLSHCVEEVMESKHKKDYKTLLQEYLQKKYKMIPTYSLVKSEGPSHNQKFYVEVCFRNRIFGPAEGHSKKDAEQNAARLAWISLGFE